MPRIGEAPEGLNHRRTGTSEVGQLRAESIAQQAAEKRRKSRTAKLREREIARVGSGLAAGKGLPFRAATDGETVFGKFTGTVQLSSGKFAVVEQGHEFTMIPWRPVRPRRFRARRPFGTGVGWQ